jgi:hypothetical protein
VETFPHGTRSGARWKRPVPREPALHPDPPLAPIIRAHLEHGNTLDALAAHSGISDRHIVRLLTGEFASMRFETADALLVAMDCPEAWLVELADLYENGNGEVAGAVNGTSGAADVCEGVSQPPATRSRGEAPSDTHEPPGLPASSARSGADERTVSMATATRKIRAPKGSRFGFHQVVGKSTICGLPIDGWKKVETGDEVTCPWCRIRIEYGVTKPTPLAGLPEEAQKAIEKEVKRRAAKREKATATA